jgi:methylated-DNA-[protein]-cysteine S-methyltransferase
VELHCSTVITPVGVWGVEGDDDVVTRIYLPHEKSQATKGPAPRAVATARTQLREYFDGDRTSFSVALSPVNATTFQRDVWTALSTIPFGEVRTYADIAAAVNRPRATRAVGNANHVNPWPVIVPCHRVVAKTGLGGYGGGDEVKRFLLDLEGVHYP